MKDVRSCSSGIPNCNCRLPLIHSNVAFTAVTSIATIGLYISYVIPTMLRLTIGRNVFVPGAPALLPEPSFLLSLCSSAEHAEALLGKLGKLLPVAQGIAQQQGTT